MTRYEYDGVTVICGDCREALAGIQGVTACVTDPPYGLKFMGKEWDHGVPGIEFWQAVYGAMLPGAHLLAFGGTRTYHRQTCAIEDAGFEIRDCIAWLYGSGFPKSFDVGKALDKAAGAERAVVGKQKRPDGRQFADENSGFKGGVVNITAPSTDAARLWNGWGTALKPAMEPLVVARKPLCGTVADNVTAHGCGALNIDACRVEANNEIINQSGILVNSKCHPGYERKNSSMFMTGKPKERGGPSNKLGRWPANVCHDGSDEVIALFPHTGKSVGGQSGVKKSGLTYSANWDERKNTIGCGFGDSGSAARFFYCAKASKAERDSGCDALDIVKQTCRPKSDDIENRGLVERLHGVVGRNYHSTVKPLALMRWLCTLVMQPERNMIIDPFAGSGTTGIACVELGIPCILIEQDAGHVEIIRARIEHAIKKRKERLF